jgi:ATP-binding cassette subfamily F protein 3
MENVGKSYGSHVVFRDATLTINRGDKVAFVGKNGEGKTTLVKCIMEEIPHDGKLQLGHNVKIGYFAQNQADLLDENLTVFETVDRVAVGDVRLKIRDILGAFMFGGEASDKKVAVLSGGERTRLAMIKLLLEPVNFLILDEPTNHLDMLTKDILKDALNTFDGTLVVVSHDREFLDGLVDKVYEFGNKRIKEHLGGIYEFLERKKLDNLKDLERKIVYLSNTKLVDSQKESKISYEVRKDYQRLLRRLEKNVEEDEKKIETLEREIKEIELILSAPENVANDLLVRYRELQKRLNIAMEQWTNATMELEKLKEG